jgi:hypothetical protein
MGGRVTAINVHRRAVSTVFIGTEEPLAVAAVAAIHTGDLATLHRLPEQNPTLATARLGTDGMSRTLLHVVTD